MTTRMEKRWIPAEAFKTVCPECRTLVNSRVEYRTVRLTRTRLRVTGVLVNVCPACDATIQIPRQSVAQLREAGVPK